jgi:Protein of unknown function (DUF2997)
MQRKEIHFVIDRDGNIQSTIKGIKGSGCGTLAAEIEKLGQVVRQEKTQEFHEKCSGQSGLLNLVHNKK